MKKRRRNLVAAVAAAGAAAIAVPLAAVSGGAPGAAPGTEARGGQVQGIEVHGDWTIEVRSPGGRLLRRARFANALSGGGAKLLRQVLARKSTMSVWRVWLYTTKESERPCLLKETPTACVVAEPSAKPEPWQFNTLNVKIEGEFLVLSGVATAQRKGKITNVGTLAMACQASVAPASCDGAKGDDAGSFTIATITGIPVEPEQKISVTVKIGFK